MYLTLALCTVSLNIEEIQLTSYNMKKMLT